MGLLGQVSVGLSYRRVTDLNETIHDDIAGGSSLADAMSRWPRSFAPVDVAMVRAGETGGFLDVVLTAKDMLNSILGTFVRLGGKVGKELLLWREVAINALNANAVFIRAVRGKLPGLICRFHLVACRAAEIA